MCEANEPNELPQLLAPVVEVTLLEDRAQVTRRGTAELVSGQQRLVLRQVAPVLADRSLRVVLHGEPEGVEIADFRVRRERRAREQDLPEELAEIRRLQREAESQRDAARRRAALLQAQAEALRAAAAQLLQEACEDCAWSRARPQRWTADLAQLRSREEVLLVEILAANELSRELERQVADLRARRARLDQPQARVETQVEIDLQAPGACRVEISVRYLVPCACWRPRYRATLHGMGAASLALQVQACTWQNTGEDWSDVLLSFSTQRPSLGTEPPLLGEELLWVQPKQERVVVEIREQDLQDTGLGRSPAQAELELPGVDDGGEALCLRAERKATVPSDGRPYRVPLASFEAEAQLERVVMAELVPAVLLRCTSSNLAPHPLLAGPVELVASSGPVGRTRLGFVAPGERFELGFGPDDTLRVFRRHEQVEQEPGALSRWRSTDHRVEVLLSNLGSQPRELRVLERVPVSELDAVEIHVDESDTTDGLQPDADGLLCWDLTLPGDGHHTVDLAWTLKKKQSVE